MKKLILFLICFSIGYAQTEDEQRAGGIAQNKVISEFFQRMQERYNASPFSTGGREADNIEWISLSIRIPNNKKTTIESSRAIFIDAMEQLLECINSSPELYPYLNHYPFTIKDVNLGVLFADEKNILEGENVACVDSFHFKNEVAYKKNIPNEPNHYGHYEDLYREPYNEAYQIVKGQTYVPPKIVYNPAQQVEHDIVEAFLEKKPGWKLLSEPSFCSDYKKSHLIHLKLEIPTTPTADEARKIYIQSVQDMIDTIQSSARFSYYFEESALHPENILFDLFFSNTEAPDIINEVVHHTNYLKPDSNHISKNVLVLQFKQRREELHRSYPYKTLFEEEYSDAYQKVTGNSLNIEKASTSEQLPNNLTFKEKIKKLFS